MSHLAAAGNENYVDLFNEIEQRHLQLCNEIIPLANRSATLTQTKVLLNDHAYRIIPQVIGVLIQEKKGRKKGRGKR